MLVDFRETFTLFVRQAVSLSRSIDVDVAFDCEARSVLVPTHEGKLRGAAMRLFHAASGMLHSGTLHLNARADVRAAGQVGVVMQYRCAGEISSRQQIAALVDWLRLTKLEDASGGNHSRSNNARGHCPITGAEVTFKEDLSSDVLLSAALTFDAEVAELNPVIPNANDAPVWIIASSDSRITTWARRFSRLGWDPHTFKSFKDAAEQLAGASRGALPKLVIARASENDDQREMAYLAMALSRVARLIYVVDAGSKALRGSPKLDGYELAVYPLGPCALEALTEDVLHETYPSNLRAPSIDVRGMKKALVVDDNELNALIGKVYFEAMGFEVLTAADGIAAIQACWNWTPDIAFINISMPLFNGVDTAKTIRALQMEGLLPFFPIIGATAAWAPSVRNAALSAGMAECISIPLDPKTFTLDVYRFSTLQ